MSHLFIHDIPCVSCDPPVCDAIERTFDRIKSKCPKDYNRLMRLVLAIVVYDDDDETTRGSWMKLPRRREQRWTWGFDIEDAPGIILIHRSIPPEELSHVLVHELGHAATLLVDKQRRGPVSDKWKSELSADRYAYKWGFGREMAKYRKHLDWKHHGVGPGGTFEELIDGCVRHYKVSRNLVAHLVNISEGYITLHWTEIQGAVRADIGDSEYVEVEFIPNGLEGATLVGDCSHDLGCWAYRPGCTKSQRYFEVWRLKVEGTCIEHRIGTKYPVRSPRAGESGSEVLGAVGSIRLAKTKNPAKGEFLLAVHRDISIGEERGSGVSSIVLTWISAKTGSLYLQEIATGEAWFDDEGALVCCYAEIEEVTEGNGVQIKTTVPDPTSGEDSISDVYYPPTEEV